MIYLLTLMMTIVALAQLKMPTIACDPQQDKAACNARIQAESQRINSANHEAFTTKLKICSNFSYQSYSGSKVLNTKTIKGYKDGHCLLETVQEGSSQKHVCLLDSRGVELMTKDMKLFSPQDDLDMRTMLTTQCKTEEANTEEVASASQAKEKASMVNELKKEAMNLKIACDAGQANSCEKLESKKYIIKPKCSDPEIKDVCAFIGII